MSNKTITGKGRPTDRTEGNIGDIYIDSISGNQYRCAGSYEIVSDTIAYYYIWIRESSGNVTPGGGNSSSGGGSADIDVTASVGQTIVVEEVDATGKPTKWKAAEYQPRTHWTEETVILPETTIAMSDEGGWEGEIPGNIEIGKTYKVDWNGIEYTCVAKDGAQIDFAGVGVLGNVDAALGTGNTGEPFILGAMDGYGMIAALDGSTTVPISITGYNYIPIPVQYMPKVGAEIDMNFNDFNGSSSTRIIHDTTEIMNALANGYPIYINFDAGLGLERAQVTLVKTPHPDITSWENLRNIYQAQGMLQYVPLLLYFTRPYHADDDDYLIFLNASDE